MGIGMSLAIKGSRVSQVIQGSLSSEVNQCKIVIEVDGESQSNLRSASSGESPGS